MARVGRQIVPATRSRRVCDQRQPARTRSGHQGVRAALQAACTRRSSRITVAGLQAPRPLGVGTPRAVNALAIPLSVATPAARTSAITGRIRRPRRRLRGLRRGCHARLVRAAGQQPRVAQLHATSLGSGQGGFRARAETRPGVRRRVVHGPLHAGAPAIGRVGCAPGLIVACLKLGARSAA